MSSLSLLLKLAAAALFGAAALLAKRKLRREEALYFQRRDILRRASALSPPASVLVLGFRSHGKSSFVNTACRVMAGEDGPLVLRAETAPSYSPAGAPVTRAERAVRVLAGGWVDEDEAVDDDEGAVVAELADTPGFAGVGASVAEEVEAAVRRRRAAAEAECAVVVMKCPGPDGKRRIAALRRLGEIVGVVREHGLHLVIVLTHREAMSGARQAEELRREAAAMARTDCVYVIENYTADTSHPFTVKNDFHTHSNVLAIIRQCIEYAAVHRGQKQRLDKSSTAVAGNGAAPAKL